MLKLTACLGLELEAIESEIDPLLHSLQLQSTRSYIRAQWIWSNPQSPLKLSMLDLQG